MGDLKTIIDLVAANPHLAGGALVVLAFFNVALFRGWIVLGRTYDREVKEKEFYRTLVLRATPVAKELADVAEKLL